MAVVIDEAFFGSLVGLEREKHLSNAEIAWFVVGYERAANYVADAQSKLFRYVEFWLETGVVCPRTTSWLERVMRELGPSRYAQLFLS